RRAVTEEPQVSVVMPLRNAAASLETAVRSVREQSFAAWELIVVDDGSCDGSGGLLAELARADERIRIERTEARGVAPAMQRACELARAPWIARMDADDWMHPERLSSQLEHAGQHPELGVISCRVGYGGEGEGYRAHVDWLNTLMDPEVIALRRFVEAPVANPSVMFCRELIALHGGVSRWRLPRRLRDVAALAGCGGACRQGG
ncbi:MAG: glycosyltransferase family 2 protein, partial [Akkermansiaceae bacterium]|nr:glycosyltransferase family 2 protein [Akkermansiaceae bacterium]